ncbi:beta-glucosidase 11-like isoform X1 [Actinidia eriantha]|uniref:beta-glucosidase 11-like isoform X1 n=2 Tax=Actinidia eriantha TaxID=165200 RepID=UPI002589B58E|nr:beta-glucosidase 11-like isoform X1 [Actinidia eriantha]
MGKLCFPLFVVLFLNSASLLVFCEGTNTITRNDFPYPPHFVFGSGTSAYQYEGAAFEDGRTTSIWDTFAYAGNSHGATGEIACDGYHKYKEDVQLMVETGLEAYRLSISWPRLIPNGRGPINPKGLEYYNNVINELIKHGIQPHATLIHFDLPQALEDEYGGWLSRKMVKDFTAYADVCFREFGDRVLYWTTMNEANMFAIGGYDIGATPPQHCSPPFGVSNCSAGNSSIEPYVAAHHILLAHASAARLYKKKYQGRQHGFVGINVYAYWWVPYTNATNDVIAARRATDFFLGWFIEPLVFGDYPDTMKKNVGTRLPTFTKRESELVKGSCDFFGVNHYLIMYIKDSPSSLKTDTRDFNMDMAVEFIYGQDDTPPNELPVTPSGLLELLEYFKQFYGNPPVYVHENGQQTQRNATLIDTPRVKYLQGYIGTLLDAVRNGSNARGYFYWSFMDLFELLSGYDMSFGLYYIDLNDKDLKRYPKLSAHWYSNFLKGNTSSSNGAIEVEKTTLSLLQSHASQ